MVVPDGKELIVLLKFPTPFPIITFVFDTVGLVVVAQTIPLSVTLTPPSELTFPPKTAEVLDMDEAAVVVTVGAVLFDTAGPTIMLSIQK